jgi:hypothetical protein
MALPRYRANNTPSPSGSAGTSGSAVSPAPAPASSGGASSASTASKNSGNSGILLGVSGGWLVARMFLFGGALWILEIIAIVITAGFAHKNGNKGQKKIAWIIIFFAGVNLFIPGFNSWVKGIRDNQLNPSPPEQSTQQQEQVAPAPLEETISTERVVVSGRKITLTGDGTYTVPSGKKSLCFENLGMKDGSSKTSQYLTIDGIEYSALGTKCHALDDTLNGEITVDFFPGKDYGSKEGVEKLYNYWRSQPGGQAEWPIIRIGE